VGVRSTFPKRFLNFKREGNCSKNSLEADSNTTESAERHKDKKRKNSRPMKKEGSYIIEEKRVNKIQLGGKKRGLRILSETSRKDN